MNQFSSVGCYPGTGFYPPVAPAAIAPYAPFANGFNIIGQAQPPVTPPAEPGVLDRTKEFLGEETAGVKNGYLLGGAALAALGLYGYTQLGWFGGKKSSRRR